MPEHRYNPWDDSPEKRERQYNDRYREEHRHEKRAYDRARYRARIERNKVRTLRERSDGDRDNDGRTDSTK